MAIQCQNGGCKVPFPRAISNNLLDAQVLRRQIEQAETLSEDPRQALNVRRHWREVRDHCEQALDVLLHLMSHSATSHDKAIAGQTTKLCRVYELHDPSCRELEQMARKRLIASPGTAGDAA